MKDLKFTSLLSVLGLLTLAFPIFGVSSQSKAEGASCNAAVLSGEYGFQDIGTRKVEGATVSYDAVRTASFDGKGNHSGKGFVSIDGKVAAYTVKGKYAVNNDCTFTVDAVQEFADGRPSQSYKQFGVVVRGGKEVLELQSTEGRNQAGKYQKVSNY